MRPLIRRVYRYGNYVFEIMSRLITKLWYKQLFGNIGDHCSIFKPLRLVNPQNIFIGDRVRIYKDSRLETVERWGNEKFKPMITIGDRTTVEQRLHLTSAIKVEIGHDVVILADVMITDINHEYSEISRNVLQQPLNVKETIIGNYCFIGMGARVMAGAKLGNNCIVGANSVVIGKFPDYVVIAGSPAKIIKRYDFEKGMWRKTNEYGSYVD
jgi:Acetyltransferase (isoleucine patch superfamily)